ncbi:MAG: hypothetical protein LBU27_04995 [Candidatus Peribacteria bacterium]|jgi:hypothetical protein|nr:hypothetical protein [Candidatus Peribacteria bacterium]
MKQKLEKISQQAKHTLKKVANITNVVNVTVISTLLWGNMSCTKPQARIQSRMPGEERSYTEIKKDAYTDKIKEINVKLLQDIQLLEGIDGTKGKIKQYENYYKSYQSLLESNDYKGDNVVNFERELTKMEKEIEKIFLDIYTQLGRKAEFETELIKAGGTSLSPSSNTKDRIKPMKNYSTFLDATKALL